MRVRGIHVDYGVGLRHAYNGHYMFIFRPLFSITCFQFLHCQFILMGFVGGAPIPCSRESALKVHVAHHCAVLISEPSDSMVVSGWIMHWLQRAAKTFKANRLNAWDIIWQACEAFLCILSLPQMDYVNLGCRFLLDIIAQLVPPSVGFAASWQHNSLCLW